MKRKISLLLTALLLVFTVSLISNVGVDKSATLNTHASTTAHAGWDDFFSTNSSDGLSFTEYEGALSSLETEGYDTTLTSSTNLREFIVRIINYALGFLGLIAVIIVIYGGVLYVSSGGDDEQVGTAKNAIKYAVIGLVIIAGSFAFVNTIIAGFGGGGAGSTNQTSITAGRVGGNFNSSSEEVKSLAYDVYSQYSNLASATEEFKNIQNDAKMESLDPDILPEKSDILEYLTVAKSKLVNLRATVPEYSEVYVLIKSLEREIEREIDLIKTFAVKRPVTLSNGEIKYCDPDDAAWYETTSPCVDLPKYYENLHEFWGENTYSVQELMDGWEGNDKKTMQELWADGDFLEPIVVQLKEEYLTYLKQVFERLIELRNGVQNYYNIDTAINNFERMADAYGFNPDSDTFRESDLAGGFYEQIKNWKLGQEESLEIIASATTYLDMALSAQADFYDDLNNLEFVEARLTANVVEGSAPLTVMFDALATSDPAGGSLRAENILWDIGGSLDMTTLMSQSVETNYIDNIILPDSQDITCDRTSEISAEDQADIEEKIGTTSIRCTFHTPGTYNSAIKIQSNDSTQYAPGISILKIKVNPPTTKINMEIEPSGSDPIKIMEYSGEELIVNKKSVTVTLEQAKAGVKFDASDTFAEEYSLSFGNGEVKDFSGSPIATAYYADSGKYQVVQEVKSKLGVIDKKIFTLEISDLAARIADVNVEKPIINIPIAFDASQSKSDQGDIRSYRWEISPSEGQVVPEDLESTVVDGRNLEILNYEFKYPLRYDIDLMVTDEEGNVSTDSLESFKVSSKPPVAQFSYKVEHENIPSLVSLDASQSFDPDGAKEYLAYSWEIDADDDQYSLLDGTTLNSEKPVILFNSKGDFSVKLEVEDILTKSNQREYDSIEKNISIEKTLDVEWGDSNVSTTFLDENGEAEVEFEFSSREAVAYEIDFGDGEVETGSITGTKTLSHIYDSADRYDAILTVFNEEDEDTSIKRKVFIGDGDNPIAKIGLYLNNTQIYDFSEPIVVNKKDILRFDASESKNTDGTGRKLLYSWDLGDTNKSSDKDLTHKYTELSPLDPGYYEVSLKVFNRDDSSQTNEDKIQIIVENIEPKFSSIQATPSSTDFQTPLTVSMKAYGAEDPDGSITQYRWWYYDLDDPDDLLGLQITTLDSTQLQIGTNGKEGEEREYAFGLMVVDNDNLSFSTEDIYTEESIPKITVVNGPNESPKASFTVSTTNVYVGDALTFVSSSEDIDGSIVKYIWDFEGDGFHNNEPTDQKTVEYKYSKMNLDGYEVKLKVVDDKGGEAISKGIKIYVDVVASPPKAAFKSSSENVSDERIISFTNNSEADKEAEASIISFAWDFDIEEDSDGDGSPDNDIDSRDENPSHLYESHGIYSAKLSVVDSQGNRSEVINDVVVGDITEISETVTGSETQYDSAGVKIDFGDEDEDSNSEIQDSEGIDGTAYEINPVLTTIPAASSDGIIYLTGDLSPVKFDFSNSEGDLKYVIFDKNTNFDTDQNGVKDDDIDFISDKLGSWQTNFEKSNQEIEVKFTMVNSFDLKKEITQKIVFN